MHTGRSEFSRTSFFLRRRLKDTPLVAGFVSVTALVVASIFFWRIFPDCYLEGAVVLGRQPSHGSDALLNAGIFPRFD